MRLTPQEPEIGPKDGFEKHDLFGYADFGARFTESLELNRLISNYYKLPVSRHNPLASRHTKKPALLLGSAISRLT